MVKCPEKTPYAGKSPINPLNFSVLIQNSNKTAV
jgi:hypothetical protein